MKLAIIMLAFFSLGVLGKSAQAEITFAHDIAPIVYDNCVSCHRPGEVAPFSLLEYSDVKKRAVQIKQVTASHFMPPWKAEPNFGHFVGERRLTDAQISLLTQWADAGAPEGDEKDLPAKPIFNDSWSLGSPDVVVKMSTPFALKADGNHGHDVYRAFVLPLDLPDTKFVSAVEFRPDNRKIVHHALFYLDSKGSARKKEKDSTDGQPGFAAFGGPGFAPTGGLGGWAPGAAALPLPDGWGRLLGKGSDLVVQVHFHPDGKDETETFSMGIYFTKDRPQHIVAGGNAHYFRINIPAGVKDYVVKADYKVPVDVEMIGITPHAHLICREMKATATLPGGEEIPLIWIKDWDFNWQGTYRYATPMKLPAGTLVHMKYIYDNSSDNIHNPNDPPKPVHFGEQTTDEMAFLFLEISPEKMSDFPTLMKSRLKF